MSIWNKVLLGLVLAVSLAYFVFAAKSLGARKYWGESINKLESDLAAVAQQKELLLRGDPTEGKIGLRQLEQEVHEMVLRRGRVWRNSTPKGVDPQTGRIAVFTQVPAPHKDVVKAQMFVFEEPSGQAPGAFLGEFTVTNVSGQQWQLEPARPMTDAERGRLARSRGTWSLYELMPGTGIEETEAAAGEAAKQETPPRLGSPEWVEKLVDYHVLLSELYRQRELLKDRIRVANNDAQSVEDSKAMADQQVEVLRGEIASTEKELAAMKTEAGLVAKLRTELEARVAALRQEIDQTERATRAAAAELARLQWEATRRIDERTGKIAQAPAAR